MVKRPQDNQTEGRRQAHRPTMSAAPRFHRHEKDARRDTPPGVSVSAPPPEGAAVRKSVILSEGRSPKSKDLRTRKRLCRWQVRRSFGSLCSLRMTCGRFLRIRRGASIHSLQPAERHKGRSLQFLKIVFGKLRDQSRVLPPRCMQVCTGIFHKTPQLYLCIHPKFSCKTPIFLKKGNNCAILFGRILESFPNFHHS